MKINSNYYNYYNLNYGVSKLTSASAGEDSSSSNSKIDAVSSATRRYPIPEENGNAINLELNGRVMMHSIQLQGVDSSEISQAMEQIRMDMDSIKNEDIDNMSTDDMKEMLAKLQSDMQFVPISDKGTSSIREADIENMSETEMKDMLKNIQAHANSGPEPPKNDKLFDGLSKIKDDLSDIKTTDIESTSTDDIKEILIKLKSDMDNFKNPYKGTNNTQATDFDGLSEENLRNMLKKIQDISLSMSLREEDAAESETDTVQSDNTVTQSI